MLLAVAVAAALAADGVAESGRSSTVPRSLVGCWSRHVPALPVGTSAGLWLVRIKANGGFAAYTPGSKACDANWDLTSHVNVASGRLTIGHFPICPTNGAYALKLAKNSFTLRKLSDKACGARVTFLVGTWKRKS
jgi:hypothetical protein